MIRLIRMGRLSLLFLSFSALSALFLGVIYAFPDRREELTKIEVGGIEVAVELADTSQKRSVGLSGREALEPSRGMFFVFDQPGYHGIWMKGMGFPLDIIWIKNGRVVDLVERAAIESAKNLGQPQVFVPDVSAEYVLEVKAGFVSINNIVIGSSVRIPQDVLGKTKIESLVAFGDTPPQPAVSAPPFYEKYYIENLRKNPATGSDFRILRLLSGNQHYDTHAISYQSGGLVIGGVMNVPRGRVPRGGYPVLILNHGLIPTEIYEMGRGSRREQDFFAKNGYVTIHPDYRGYAFSSPNPETHHDFYVGHSEDAMALIDALKEYRPDFTDLERIGVWGHSMGGGIASRVMVLRPEIRAFVLFAPISAYAEDNFYELPESELAWLKQNFGEGEEARKVYDKISPIMYFENVSAPVQFHHASTDKEVPIKFSEKMFDTLKRYGKIAEFFVYPGEKHEFIDSWSVAARRSLAFFDKYVKNTR